MKRCIVAAICMMAASQAHAEPIWVQVRQSQVRSQPKFYAQSLGPVRYGERLEKLSEDGGWVKVQLAAKQGYLPLSAVSQDQIVLSSAELLKVRADSAEVVLAGKGFSKEVEQRYRSEASGSRYDLVDYVEQSSRVSPAEVQQFMKQGGLGK